MAGNGRKPISRTAMLKAFIAKAVYDYPTTELLRENLLASSNLRRLCGWKSVMKFPHCPPFPEPLPNSPKAKSCLLSMNRWFALNMVQKSLDTSAGTPRPSKPGRSQSRSSRSSQNKNRSEAAQGKTNNENQRSLSASNYSRSVVWRKTLWTCPGRAI